MAASTSDTASATLRRVPTGQPVDGPAVVPPAGLVAGRYRLLEEIGRGGMATVHRALDKTLDRQVAVKLIHPALCADRAFLLRFLETERRVARLSHPNLVTIFDAGSERDAGGRCFVVMEEITGGSLRSRLAKGRPLPVAEAVRVAGQIARALQYLHANDIVHGDVKPENVLIDERGDARLADFGVSHLGSEPGAAGIGNTVSASGGGAGGRAANAADDRGRSGGTAAYLAPEQVEGHPPHACSDVYALGLVLYEMLAGVPAFTGDTPAATAAQRLVRDPAPLASLRRDVPPDVVRATEHALARTPRQRSHTAEIFRQELEASARKAPGARETTVAPALAPVLAAAVDGARAMLPALASWRHVARRVSTYRPVPLDRNERLVAVGLLALTLLLLVIVLPRALSPPAPASPVASVGAAAAPVVRVPDIGNRRPDDARRDLEAAGLALGAVEERETARQPWGAVIAQNARPGASLVGGSSVNVVVGLPPSTQVPPLVDRPIGDAESELQKRGLRLGEVRQEKVAGKAPGTVITQDAPAGSRLRQGDSVAVAIAVPAAQ